MKQNYSIGELAELAGVSTKTLRVYERKGLLLPERNKENQYRIYTEDAVRELEKIQLMKYLGFSLDQIEGFLRQYENVSREDMLLSQKRLLERKREQLNSVISCVEQAVAECRETEPDSNAFLRSLGGIVKNRKADELAWRLGQHSDEPRGWSRYVFEQAGLMEGMRVLDAGAGYGNLWRYNLERLPEDLRITCVDKHNTHADDFYEYIIEKEAAGECKAGQFTFCWADLELRKNSEFFHCIFFNHVASFIQDRTKLYQSFRESLAEGGKVICTWGGYLLSENVMALLGEFLEEPAPLMAKCKKHASTLKRYEAELRAVFPKVKRYEYVTTLRFATAEQFMDYILQVGKSVEVELEERRSEFLEFLHRKQNEQGEYEFVRDTYLFCCGREA